MKWFVNIAILISAAFLIFACGDGDDANSDITCVQIADIHTYCLNEITKKTTDEGILDDTYRDEVAGKCTDKDVLIQSAGDCKDCIMEMKCDLTNDKSPVQQCIDSQRCKDFL